MTEKNKLRNEFWMLVVITIIAVPCIFLYQDYIWVENSKKIYYENEMWDNIGGTLRIHRSTGEIQEATEVGFIETEHVWHNIGYAKNDTEKQLIIELFKEEKLQSGVSVKQVMIFTVSDFITSTHNLATSEGDS